MTAPARGWAVVTGASSGIGASFARALDARGYSLLLVARRRERLEELARTLRRAEVLAADLGDEAEVARVAAHALALGDVELLVNNAGFGTQRRRSSRSTARARSAWSSSTR